MLRSALINGSSTELYLRSTKARQEGLPLISCLSSAGTWSLSENEAEIQRLHKQRDALLEKEWDGSHLAIATTLLLDQKSMAMEKSDTPSQTATDSETVINGYKQLLYRTLSLQPSGLVIEDCDPDKNPAQFIKIMWGRNQWELSHTGGLVTFDHLMRIEDFNLEYQRVLTQSALEILNKMIKLAESVSTGEPREPDDPIVLAMGRKEKMMKALEYSVDHFSAVDAAKRVFGATPQQLAINIGIMIGIIIALAIIGSLGPVGALIAGGITATLLVIFGIDTVATTIKALKHLYDNTGTARNQKDLANTGKLFAEEGGEAALKILLFVLSGKVAKRFAKGGKVEGAKTDKSLFHQTRNLKEIVEPGQRKVPIRYTMGLLNRTIEGPMILGGAEGSVYAGPRLAITGFQKALMGLSGKYPGIIEFRGNAVSLFSRHPVEGWYSGIKSAAGQHKSPMGNIRFTIDGVKNYFVSENHLVLNEVELVPLRGAERVVGQLRYLGRIVTLEVSVPLIFIYMDDIAAWIADVIVKPANQEEGK